MSSLGSARAAIDHCYEEFISGLPDELRSAARHLPLRLGLSSRAGVGWSEVFEEPTEVALPSLLLAQLGRPPVGPKLRICAQRAHLFALLGTLVSERLDGRVVEVDADVDAVLLAIERQRHRAIAELRLLGADRNSSFAAAERELRGAAAIEIDVFEGRRVAAISDYVAICSAKHSLAFPATMAAVVAAGAELDELAQVHDLILGITLGASCRREVTERVARTQAQRSWVVALSGPREQAEVVGELLELAVDAFARAAAAADALGATQLGVWANHQGRQVRAFADAEAKAGRAA